jgi:hypothetical protein
MTSVYDNGVYTLPSDSHLAKLFDCKEPFLKSAPNARLYDIFDGNFNVKSKTPITPAKCYDVPVIKYANNAVFSDFPRGAGLNGTTFMYDDATYNEMLRAVERQNAEVPAFLQAENRLQEYDLAQRTGGNLFVVNDMVNRMKSDLVREEEDKIVRGLMTIPGMTGENAKTILERYRLHKEAKALETTQQVPGLANIVDEVVKGIKIIKPVETESQRELREVSDELEKELKTTADTARRAEIKRRLIAMRRFRDAEKAQSDIDTAEAKYDMDRQLGGFPAYNKFMSESRNAMIAEKRAEAERRINAINPPRTVSNPFNRRRTLPPSSEISDTQALNIPLISRLRPTPGGLKKPETSLYNQGRVLTGDEEVRARTTNRIYYPGTLYNRTAGIYNPFGDAY